MRIENNLIINYIAYHVKNILFMFVIIIILSFSYINSSENHTLQKEVYAMKGISEKEHNNKHENKRSISVLFNDDFAHGGMTVNQCIFEGHKFNSEGKIKFITSKKITNNHWQHYFKFYTDNIPEDDISIGSYINTGFRVNALEVPNLSSVGKIADDIIFLKNYNISAENEPYPIAIIDKTSLILNSHTKYIERIIGAISGCNSVFGYDIWNNMLFNRVYYNKDKKLEYIMYESGHGSELYPNELILETPDKSKNMQEIKFHQRPQNDINEYDVIFNPNIEYNKELFNEIINENIGRMIFYINSEEIKNKYVRKYIIESLKKAAQYQAWQLTDTEDFIDKAKINAISLDQLSRIRFLDSLRKNKKYNAKNIKKDKEPYKINTNICVISNLISFDVEKLKSLGINANIKDMNANAIECGVVVSDLYHDKSDEYNVMSYAYEMLDNLNFITKKNSVKFKSILNNSNMSIKSQYKYSTELIINMIANDYMMDVPFMINQKVLYKKNIYGISKKDHGIYLFDNVIKY